MEYDEQVPTTVYIRYNCLQFTNKHNDSNCTICLYNTDILKYLLTRIKEGQI